MTVSRSATVRNRMISTESASGISSSTAVQGHTVTSTSRLSAKNPTAKWAIGEMLITTGLTSRHWIRGHPCIIPSV